MSFLVLKDQQMKSTFQKGNLKPWIFFFFFTLSNYFYQPSTSWRTLSNVASDECSMLKMNCFIYYIFLFINYHGKLYITFKEMKYYHSDIVRVAIHIRPGFYQFEAKTLNGWGTYFFFLGWETKGVDIQNSRCQKWKFLLCSFLSKKVRTTYKTLKHPSMAVEVLQSFWWKGCMRIISN